MIGKITGAILNLKGFAPILHSQNDWCQTYARIIQSIPLPFPFNESGVFQIREMLFQAFPRQITGIFGAEDELYFQFADRYLRIFMMMVCVSGMQPISESYFTCTGNVRQGIALSLLKQAFFVVLLLLFPALYGIDGFLYAGPISDLMTFVLTIALISWDFRKYPEIQRYCKTA